MTTTTTRTPTKLVRRALEHLRDARDVLRDRRLRRAAAEFERAEVLEPEQLVRVPVLLVIVDQARVRRGRDHAVERAAEVEHPCVAVEHARGPPALAHTGERLHACHGVERIATQEVLGPLDGTTLPLVLVAPSMTAPGCPRKIEVEVSLRRAERAARARTTRACRGARSHRSASGR